VNAVTDFTAVLFSLFFPDIESTGTLGFVSHWDYYIIKKGSKITVRGCGFGHPASEQSPMRKSFRAPVFFLLLSMGMVSLAGGGGFTVKRTVSARDSV
jgi:hypothetical protein